MTVDRQPVYRLAPRRTGTALLGLAVPQVILLAAGAAAVVLIPATTRSGAGAVTGLVVAAACAAVAFCPVGGQPLYGALPVLLRYAARRAVGRAGWSAPLPLLTPAAGKRVLAVRARPATAPACLAGLELVSVRGRTGPASAGPWRR
ncbi:MAG TPA: hypothetical protein VEL73_02040, partial [Mycobacteriales bacterium]|nr:hypothetical protein [Mycobacteriales bacterium]